MYKTSSNLSILCFRNRGLAWTMLTAFLFSFIPSTSLAQQPTVTIKTLSGNVLVSGQAATVGAVLQVGDTIQTQAGASVVLELSDGSTLELGENTNIDIAMLIQESNGARMSQVKLLWGRVRALLSPGHQKEGSTFNIETPNALVGVKFSQPKVEVIYDPNKQETTGIAHTVELLVTNLLTGETKLIPVGSSVIISAMGIKVIAGIMASAGSAGLSTGTITAVGVGVAAAAGGVAAVTVSGNNKSNGETAESTGDLSGIWDLSAQGVAQGCTEHTPCESGPPYRCGTDLCGSFSMGDSDIHVSQSGNEFSMSGVDSNGKPFTLNGRINGNSVSFTIQGDGITPGIGSATTEYTGTIDRNTISGNFQGSASWITPGGGTETATWTGTFTVTIEKE